MPWSSIKKAKEAKAITRYSKKAISIAAINKLYSIYDSIKAQGGADNPFAVAMASWKQLVTLKNGRIWVMKPQKKKKSEQHIDEQGIDLPLPAGMSYAGDGSLESFKDNLQSALKGHFGGKKYVYIVATYRSKVVVSVEGEGGGASNYYELTYKVSKAGIEFGSPIKMKKIIKYQKAEQQFKKKVSSFVNGKMNLGEVVKVGIKTRRHVICRPES